MATLVKFRKHESEVFAYFPQLNYNKRKYGNSVKTCYAHVGQHSLCHKDYAKNSEPANESEYLTLKQELESIGYDLKICK
jgi:hypothetical protein